MPFEFKPLAIPEVVLITPSLRSDDRGFFMETYKRSDFADAGIPDTFEQVNHSNSVQGVLRGLHFQRPPRAQSKLVRVVAGRIFDVAVDLRPKSQTRGAWVGAELSSDNRMLLYIPAWCAHGFCVLSERAEVVYHTSTEYSPDHESGIMWNDPALGIGWPVAEPILSERDMRWPLLSGVR